MEHIVVGGGPGGTALSSTLLQNGHNVIIVESGDESEGGAYAYSGCLLPESLSWTYRAYHTSLAKRYISLPQVQLNNRQILVPQGHGIGGTTNINAQIFTLGHPAIFDLFWPEKWKSINITAYIEHLLSRTNYKTSVVPSSGIFKRIINVSKQEMEVFSVNERYRNFSGYEPTYLISASSNGSLYDSRITAARLLPSSDPDFPGLTILRKCKAIKVAFDGSQATGVYIRDIDCNGLCGFSTNGEKRVGDACRCGLISTSHGGEVILSAGSFETPRILMNSGFRDLPPLSIGTKEMNSSEVPFIEGIGRNLQDHPLVAMIFIGNWWRDWSAMVRRQGKLRAKYPVNCIHGWINLDGDGNVIQDDDTLPVIQLLLSDGRIIPGVLEPLLLPIFKGSPFYQNRIRPLVQYFVNWIARLWLVRWISGLFLTVIVCCVSPQSRGNLSVDPRDREGQLLIDFNYLGDERDSEALRQGLFAARNLVAEAKKERGFWAMELMPGCLLSRVGPLHSLIKLTVAPYYHASGSCGMNTSEKRPSYQSQGSRRVYSADQGVVDQDLRVHGVSRLRIADASVIPRIPTGPTTATCMAIGIAAGNAIISEK